MITPAQQRLVRRSFEHLRLVPDRAGEMFYEQLFTLSPALVPLFNRVSMPTQAKKLMHVLETVVGELDDLTALQARMGELGAKQVAYGVRPDHYSGVGVALIRTLELVLGAAFTAETEEAWTELYTHISLAMERGAASGGNILTRSTV